MYIASREQCAIAAYIVKHLWTSERFGRTELMVLLYLTETHIGLPLGGTYKRGRWGPRNCMIEEIESRGEEFRWFASDRDNGWVRYSPEIDINGGISLAHTILGDRKNEMDRLLQLFKDTRTRRAYTAGALFAVWNDFILDGIDPIREKAIAEVQNNWSDQMRDVSHDRLKIAFNWLRENDLIPRGIGPKTVLGDDL